MTHMPARIARGLIPEKISDWVNAAPKTRATQAVTILGDTTTYPYLISNNPGDNVLDNLVPPLTLTAQEKKHLQAHWLDVDDGWWQPYQPVEPILRQGLLEACTRSADGTGKPLDCYWVCAADLWEVWVLDGPAQVTALISTPPPDDWSHIQLSDPENIWIVRRYLEGTGEKVGGAGGQNATTGVMTVRLFTGPI